MTDIDTAAIRADLRAASGDREHWNEIAGDHISDLMYALDAARAASDRNSRAARTELARAETAEARIAAALALCDNSTGYIHDYRPSVSTQTPGVEVHLVRRALTEGTDQ